MYDQINHPFESATLTRKSLIESIIDQNLYVNINKINNTLRQKIKQCRALTKKMKLTSFKN